MRDGEEGAGRAWPGGRAQLGKHNHDAGQVEDVEQQLKMKGNSWHHGSNMMIV